MRWVGEQRQLLSLFDKLSSIHFGVMRGAEAAPSPFLKIQLLCLGSRVLLDAFGYFLNRHGDNLMAVIPKEVCDFCHDFLLALCAKHT
jgi:hypothetical protein